MIRERASVLRYTYIAQYNTLSLRRRNDVFCDAGCRRIHFAE